MRTTDRWFGQGHGTPVVPEKNQCSRPSRGSHWCPRLSIRCPLGTSSPPRHCWWKGLTGLPLTSCQTLPFSIVSAFAPWESVSGGFLECRLGDHGGEVKKGGVTGGFGDPRLGFCLHFFLQAMRHITSRLCVFIFSFGTWR